jgi:hypothetical protein
VRQSREARRLREMACLFAEHIHDEPNDSKDSLGLTRWEKLAQAAYEFARTQRRTDYHKRGGK